MLSTDFADVFPVNEDLMPFKGNPHSLPRQMHFDNHNWAMPEFPEIGWNDVPSPANNHN